MRIRPGLLLALALPLVLSGCAGMGDKIEASFARKVGVESCGMNRDDVLSRINLRELVREATLDFCTQIAELAPRYQEAKHGPKYKESTLGYVVPDVVDIHTLKPEPFGIVLGELLREHVVTQCKAPVRQAEFLPNMRLEPGGMVALSRDVSAPRAKEIPSAAAVVGTYHLQTSKITFVVRRVGVETGLVDAMASRHVEWSCSILRSGQSAFSYQIR